MRDILVDLYGKAKIPWSGIEILFQTFKGGRAVKGPIKLYGIEYAAVMFQPPRRRGAARVKFPFPLRVIIPRTSYLTFPGQHYDLALLYHGSGSKVRSKFQIVRESVSGKKSLPPQFHLAPIEELDEFGFFFAKRGSDKAAI